MNVLGCLTLTTVHFAVCLSLNSRHQLLKLDARKPISCSTLPLRTGLPQGPPFALCFLLMALMLLSIHLTATLGS